MKIKCEYSVSEQGISEINSEPLDCMLVFIIYLTRGKNVTKENILVNEIKRKIRSNYLYMYCKVAS